MPHFDAGVMALGMGGDAAAVVSAFTLRHRLAS